MADRIQLRRDTAANWTSANPVLAQGELGIETDTLKIKAGNGTSTWTAIGYLIDTGNYLTTAAIGTSVPSIIGYNNTNWDTAYGWGNHSSAGYLASATAESTYQAVSAKNVANGYAGLDASGIIPSTILPSYVDDVLEYANLATFPGTGEGSKIYVALDTNKTYRWSGSTYVEISASPGTTDSLTEGATNLYFTPSRARGSVSATQNLTYDSSTGVFTGPDLSSYLTSSAAASTYAPISTTVTLTGTQTLSGKTITGLRETRVAIAASNIDLSLGNYFTRTISGTTTLTVSNTASAGTVSAFVLDLTNGGSATVNWFSGVKWAGGTAPTLTSAGRDVLGFFTHDGGTTWSGFLIGKDVK